MSSKNPKQIKLQSRYRTMSCGQKVIPELKISGAWLDELGFKAGDHVAITTREKLLIIEPVVVEEGEEVNYKEALKEVKQTLKKLL